MELSGDALWRTVPIRFAESTSMLENRRPWNCPATPCRGQFLSGSRRACDARQLQSLELSGDALWRTVPFRLVESTLMLESRSAGAALDQTAPAGRPAPGAMCDYTGQAHHAARPEVPTHPGRPDVPTHPGPTRSFNPSRPDQELATAPARPAVLTPSCCVSGQCYSIL